MYLLFAERDTCGRWWGVDGVDDERLSSVGVMLSLTVAGVTRLLAMETMS